MIVGLEAPPSALSIISSAALTSASRSTAASARVTSAPALRPAVAFGDRGREHLLHLARDGRQIAEPVGCARREVAAAQGRLELDRADEQLARGTVRLAGERAQARLGERLGRLALQLDRRRAVELGEQRGRAVEVERADLEQLLARALLQPPGEARVVLGPRRLGEPEYATSRIRTCLNL